MGDIIKTLRVCLYEPEKSLNLQLHFDSGSPQTFVKETVAKELGGIFLKLPQPREFLGLGNGKFYANYIMPIKIELIDVWCEHLVYVVPDDTFKEDILVGHDFMQKYRIKLDPENLDIICDRDSLIEAYKIKRCQF